MSDDAYNLALAEETADDYAMEARELRAEVERLKKEWTESHELARVAIVGKEEQQRRAAAAEADRDTLAASNAELRAEVERLRADSGRVHKEADGLATQLAEARAEVEFERTYRREFTRRIGRATRHWFFPPERISDPDVVESAALEVRRDLDSARAEVERLKAREADLLGRCAVLNKGIARLKQRTAYCDEDGCCGTCGGDVVMFREERDEARSMLGACRDLLDALRAWFLSPSPAHESAPADWARQIDEVLSSTSNAARKHEEEIWNRAVEACAKLLCDGDPCDESICDAKRVRALSKAALPTRDPEKEGI